MNEWIERSIRLANSKGYLDELLSIYPMEPSPPRMIAEKTKREIEESFKGVDKLELIKALLDLPKFPIDNPYIPSLRSHRELVNKNPTVVEKIGEQIISNAIRTILTMAEQPKKTSRQLGSSFKKWLQETIGYPFVGETEFIKSDKIVFLEGSERALRQFTRDKLGLSKTYPVDFVLKIRDKSFMGQAKFLTTAGGSQRKQFDEAVRVAEVRKKNITGMAVLDGELWFESRNYMAQKIRRFNGLALSALLLKEFIKKGAK